MVCLPPLCLPFAFITTNHLALTGTHQLCCYGSGLWLLSSPLSAGLCSGNQYELDGAMQALASSLACLTQLHTLNLASEWSVLGRRAVWVLAMAVFSETLSL